MAQFNLPKSPVSPTSPAPDAVITITTTTRTVNDFEMLTPALRELIKTIDWQIARNRAAELDRQNMLPPAVERRGTSKSATNITTPRSEQ